MNLDELRSAQAKERRKDSLQHLRDSFYDDVAAYVGDLRAARDRRAEQVDKPFSDDDVRRMSDEVETAEEVAEALYERRVGKVVKLASFAAADMPVEDEGMTTEERELFDDLVGRIGQNKSRVLDVLSGETPPSGSDEASPASEPAAVSPASVEPTADAVDESTPGSAAASDTADSDALAGAMGGSEADAAEDVLHGDADEASPAGAGGAASGGVGDAVPDAHASPATDPAADPTADPTAETDGSAAATEPTAVPPEPAPPGAPGVEDAEPRTAASDAASDAETGPERRGDGGVAHRAADADHQDAADPSTRDDRTTVKITRDVGAILGVDDREYDLASEDVVTLPAENADPLVQRDAAERLD